MKTQNKWEKLFEEFLECVEFTLVKYKTTDEEYNPWRWGVRDRQYANLGDIESDRFSCAEDILDRMDTYITDYFYADLEDEISAYGVSLEWREVPDGAEEWLLLRSDVEFVEKYKKYFDNHSWEFEVLDMIVNHVDEINLENIFYEED